MVWKFRSFILLTCLRWIVISNVDGNSDTSEWISANSDEECWALGGVTRYNGSNVMTPESPKNNFKTKINEEEVYIRYSSNHPNANGPKKNCEFIKHHKCYQDIHISNHDNLELFSSFNCERIFGSLIISLKGKYQDTLLNFKPFEKLQKIYGRLVINSLYEEENSIIFEKLTEVGNELTAKSSHSTIEIMRNYVDSIRFPSLAKIHCSKNPEAVCVKIGKSKKTVLSFKAGKVDLPKFPSRERNPRRPDMKYKFTEEERDEIKHASYFEEKEIPYVVRPFRHEGWGGYTLVHTGFTVTSFLSSIGFLVYVFKQFRNSEQFDMKPLEALDEVSYRENDDENYFKKDGDKSSGMDDLGST